MWYLEHKREYKFITWCVTYEQALREYYRQYRDPDGSIPWVLKNRDTDD